MTRIELLAPAKDLACGKLAIDCGADAVYVGPARFGAREAAGNGLAEIAALVEHAHVYWARVYATVNTLLHDEEMPAALRLIDELYRIGVDGLIIQDAGLLECDLPPLPLIASTQMHNATPERVAFLEQVGFQRAILARELSLEEIAAIRRATTLELECFVHGALCVCYSGQCALSYALGGRSGNRGQCAQPCRKPYTLRDGRGRMLARDKHLLSIRDLRLDDHLGDLLRVGVSSFKIEGRLKDAAYVANVVSHYRARLDAAMAEQGLRRSASGVGTPGFTPDVEKTFNRGFSTYFLYGRDARIGSIDTPKMTGERLGTVTHVSPRGVVLDTETALHNGDGLCFFTESGELRGTMVNAVTPTGFLPASFDALTPGTVIYRNHDHAFLAAVAKSTPERKIGVAFTLVVDDSGLRLRAVDEDGVTVEQPCPGAEPAANPDGALATLKKQLAKCGGTPFACIDITVEGPVPFLPVGELNALRRATLAALLDARAAARPVATGGALRNDVPYPERELSFLGNVLNRKARAFYQRHGVTAIEPAAESGLDLRGRQVMTTRYCLKHQLGLCPRDGATAPDPLTLTDAEGHVLELRFDCAACRMAVWLR
jgi:putative protease